MYARRPTYVLALLTAASAAAADPPLTTAQAVRRLPAAAAAQPVRLTGVVTYFHPPTNELFVQDATAGVRVHPRGAAAFAPGTVVRVEGVTDAGAADPRVRAAGVTAAGTAPLPEAVPYDLKIDDARWLDAQLVSVWVIVTSAKVTDGDTHLAVATRHGDATLVVPARLAEADPAAYRGRCVRAVGVLVPGFDGRGERVVERGPTIYASARPRITDPAGPAAPPVTLANELRRFVPDPHPAGRRVTVAGVATAVGPWKDGHLVLVQDGDAGVRVECDGPAAVRAGDRVSATSLLTINGRRMRLRQAVAAGSGPAGPVVPVPAAAADLAAGHLDARLVAVDGTVIDDRRIGGNLTALVVEDGDIRFEALFPGPSAAAGFDALPAGTQVRLTGTATDAHPAGDAPGEFALWLRTPADVLVLAAAPAAPVPAWWTARRAVAAALLAALVMAGGAAWVVALRARVRHQTRVIRAARQRDADTEDRYRDLFDHAGDAVWETSPAGDIVALNPAAEQLLNIPAAEAVGRPITDFIDQADWDLVRGSRVGRHPAPFEITILPRGGVPTPAEVSARAQFDGRMLAIARNVAERKKALERAGRSQKLEALGRLAGGIAHDFNNLLTVINGNAELLAAGLPPDDPNADLAGQIRAAGERAAGLTRQLLVFGRQRSVERQPVDLARVVGGTADLLHRLIPESIAVDIRLAPNTPWVLAEPALLEQIVLNLTLNARDAVAGTGTVAITTGRGPDGTARLTVADDGCGMDAATQARVYEPFFTTKPVGQGTGLGLATVYGAVQALDGQLRFDSSPGRGTTFEVDLPALPIPAPPAEAPAPPAVPGAGGRPLVVLLVEDDDGVRELARNILAGHGCRVLTADDGLAALETAADYPGPLDLVITDVVMPHLTGRELAEQLRAVRPGVRVLYMSGYAGDELADRGPPFAEAEFLQKPFTAAELMRRVRGLAGERGASAP